jgi:transposase
MSGRKPYRSDLSDAEWALIESELAAWRAPRLQRKVCSESQPVHDLREIVNAILYINRTGCAWEYLPHDFPPFKTVYGYFAAWRDEGTSEQIHDVLRRRLRRSRGRAEEPTAVAVDSQSVKASANAADTVGFDGNKKTKGRKRHIAVDTIGLLVVLGVSAASLADSPVLPRWWVVERTFGWFMMLHRRLAGDYETRQESSCTMIHWSIIGVMGRALTHTSIPSWQDLPQTAT